MAIDSIDIVGLGLYICTHGRNGYGTRIVELGNAYRDRHSRTILWFKMSRGVEVKIIKMVIDSSGYTAMDITSYVNSVVKSHGLSHGLAHIFTPEKKCSITLIEYEPELLADLEEFLKRVGCIDVGLCDAVIGKGTVLPVVNGSLFTGQFKRIVFIDTSRTVGEKSVVLTLEGIFKDD
ncbi:MAG: YjbQ family protein [Ignisphaera sp.]